MGLSLAENGIFPSFTAPEVGVTPNFARFALDSLEPPFPVSWIRHCLGTLATFSIWPNSPRFAKLLVIALARVRLAYTTLSIH